MSEPRESTEPREGRKRKARAAARGVEDMAPGAADAASAEIPTATMPTALVTTTAVGGLSDTLFRDTIIAAAAQVGLDGEGTDGLKGYLRSVAKDDRKTYFGVLAKLIAPDLASTAGETVTRIERVIVRERE